MKIVFFTNKSFIGAEVLKQMKSKNILIEAIFIDIGKSTNLRKRVKKWQRKLKQRGSVKTLKLISKRLKKRLAPMELKMLYYRVRRKLAPGSKEEWLNNNFYYFYSNKVYMIDSFNGKKCEQILKEIEPDIIILGGSRIIRKNIISIPKIGIFNAHPGLLPKYRGIDVIPWAIYYGDPIGVTIHFVDVGIDTGGIVAQKGINITENDTIDSLGEKAGIVAGELMAETSLKIVEKGHIQVMTQSIEDGKRYSRIPLKLFWETKRRLKRMRNESKCDWSEGQPHN